MSQTAEAGDAALQLVGATGVGQRLLDELTRLRGRLGGVGWILLHFLPEAHWIAQFAQSQKAQPLVMLGEYESFAAGGQGIAVALLDRVGGFAAGEAEVFGANGQVGASREPNQIQGIRARPSFVEVVYPPDEAAFFVAPSAEILDVQVADG